MREIASTSLISFVGKSGLASHSWVLKAIFETIRMFFFPVCPVVDCAVNKYLCMHFCFFFHVHETWLMSFSVTSLFTELSSFLTQSSILSPLCHMPWRGEEKWK